MPLDRIEAKFFRWLAEFTGDGSLLKFRAGLSNQAPDALSRNPQGLLLWEAFRGGELDRWRGIIKGFDVSEFNDAEPEPFVLTEAISERYLGGSKPSFVARMLRAFRENRPPS